MTLEAMEAYGWNLCIVAPPRNALMADLVQNVLDMKENSHGIKFLTHMQ